MKKFLEKYSYSCLKMFVTQIAISIFGFSLAIASTDLSKPLQYLISAGAVLFYLILIYSIPWKHGNEDSLSVEYGKMKRNLLTGLYMGILANSINLLVSVGATLFYIMGVKSVYSILSVFSLFMQGMYTGLLSYSVGYYPLNSFPWMHILITVPAILISTVAYIAGYGNVRIFKFKDKR